jgi:hypothetical protein
MDCDAGSVQHSVIAGAYARRIVRASSHRGVEDDYARPKREGRTLDGVASPIRAYGERLQLQRHPPKLGLHSAAILAEAGFDEIQPADFIEKVSFRSQIRIQPRADRAGWPTCICLAVKIRI